MEDTPHDAERDPTYDEEKEDETESPAENNDLEEWQQEIVKKFKKELQATKHWTKEEFDKLEDGKLTGSSAYLNDSIFHYVLLLAKSQYPHIQGLQDTMDYATVGLDRVDPKLPFLQPAHSGALHWTLLSNVQLSEEERCNRKLCLYDSMVNLSTESDLQAALPSAIEWQACQAYAKETWRQAQPIHILGMPCEQQSNSYDCGMYVVMNMVSLAMGHDPSSIVYKGNFRKQLLSMIKRGELCMFHHEKLDPSGPNQRKFTVFSQTKVRKAVFLQPTTNTILPVCYCQQSESYDNVVFCSECNVIYHQQCHLMGSNTGRRSIAESLDGFLCFSCRISGDYTRGFGIVPAPEPQSIKRVIREIDSLPYNKLAAHVHKLILKKKEVPVTMASYHTVQCLLARYDLNSLSSKSSPLWTAVENFYNRHCHNLPRPRSFDEFTIADVTILRLM